MGKFYSRRLPVVQEVPQADFRLFERRVQKVVYFELDSIRVVLATMDERLGNTATREDIAKVKFSLIKWYIGSILSLAGILVAAFKWLL